jgi:hypothetical protein
LNFIVQGGAGMNLSLTLKRKRDAEDRLRRTSQQPVFSEASGGEQSFSNPDDYATKGDLAGKADTTHSHSFLSLTDTPDSFAGQAGKVPFVKATEDGFEFKPAGSGGTGAFDYGLITSPADINYNYGGLTA